MFASSVLVYFATFIASASLEFDIVLSQSLYEIVLVIYRSTSEIGKNKENPTRTHLKSLASFTASQLVFTYLPSKNTVFSFPFDRRKLTFSLASLLPAFILILYYD